MEEGNLLAAKDDRRRGKITRSLLDVIGCYDRRSFDLGGASAGQLRARNGRTAIPFEATWIKNI